MGAAQNGFPRHAKIPASRKSRRSINPIFSGDETDKQICIWSPKDGLPKYAQLTNMIGSNNPNGCGSKLSRGGYAGSGPCLHLPGFQFGTGHCFGVGSFCFSVEVSTRRKDCRPIGVIANENANSNSMYRALTIGQHAKNAYPSIPHRSSQGPMIERCLPSLTQISWNAASRLGMAKLRFGRVAF